MSDNHPSRPKAPGSWLAERVTVTLPRWALLGAGAAALILLVVALD